MISHPCLLVGRAVVGIVTAISLSGCSGSGSALIASGGPADFAAMGRVSEQYGDGEPDAVVPVPVGDQQYSFRIWASKDGHRIMAQSSSTAGIAAAGFIRGLTGGLVKGDLDYEPFKRAASDYLSQSQGPSCTLTNSRQLNHIGWEWDVSCPDGSANAPPKIRRNPNG